MVPGRLEQNKLITPVQAGLCKQCSTTDHLVCVEAFVCDSMLSLFFFRLAKAYESTWKFGIELFKRLKIPSMFWHLPFTPIWPGNGMSQDSILSVSLFGLKINSVLKLYLLVLRVLSMWTILSFVTDLNIFISSKDTWADVSGFVQHIWNHSFSLMASRFLSLKKPNSWHNFWP